MAIKGLGTDIVDVARFDERVARLGDKLARRLLTDNEWQQWQAAAQPGRFLAKRFAAKEAAAKALGTGIGRGVSFQHMEIHHTDWGAPKLRFSEGAAARFAELGASQCHLSLSDEQAYVVATVILDD